MACGEEGACGCCSKLSKKPPTAPRRKDNDYNVEDEYKVAHFKRNMVAKEMNYSFLSTKAIQSMFDPRYISQSILGKTWKILLVFTLLWICLQVLVQTNTLCIIFSNAKLLNPNSTTLTKATPSPTFMKGTKPTPTNPKATPSLNFLKVTKPTPTNPKATPSPASKKGTGTSSMCTPYEKKRLDFFLKAWNENDQLSAVYLVFLLGFYVKQLVSRWWDQVKNLPEIDSILNQTSGLVFDISAGQSGVSPASLSLAKRVARYSLLSWTMCMSSISKPINDNFKIGKNFIDKGLLTQEEFEQLQVGKSEDGWRDQWMIPLNWAICDTNIASNKTKLIPKDHKNLVGALNRYQDQLRHLCRVNKNPLPAIYKQAVTFCMWGWLVMGILGSQGSVRDSGVLNGIWVNFPYYQGIKILLLFGWLKVSEMIHNPFGTDKNFDINVVDRLDVEIWKASVAIKNIDQAV